MKKIITLLAFLLITISLQAQFTTLWERSEANSSTKPGWFGSTTERGLAYGNVGGEDRVYVASRNDGTKVKIINAHTGADIGDLTTTGIAGGFYTINDMAVSSDGVIFACNMTTDATGVSNPFKVYKWTSEASAPTNVISFNSVVAERLGDRFTVIGSASDNSLTIYAAAASSATVHKFTTADGGNTFTETTITLSSVPGIGAQPCIAPLSSGSSAFYYKAAGAGITKYDASGNLIGTGASATVADGHASLVYIKANGSDDFLAVARRTPGGLGYGSTVKVAGADPSNNACSNWEISTNLGTTSTGGYGDIDVKDNNDGTYTIFVLGANEGIGAYTTSKSPLNVINGDLSNSFYTTLAEFNSGRDGFGADNAMSKLKYYADGTDMYFGIEGKLADANRYILFMNFSGYNGRVGNQSLKGDYSSLTGSGDISDLANNNIRLGMEVDYVFEFKRVGSTIYWDANRLGTDGFFNDGSYVGSTNITAENNTIGLDNTNVFVATDADVKFAFDNSGTADKGLEFKIPISAFQGAFTSATTVQFQAIIANNNATIYFSNESIPGDPGASNAETNPDLTMLTGTNPAVPLPVELTSFRALPQGEFVNLTWETATEVNNYGFEIERSVVGTTHELSLQWDKVGFVEGHGNSNSVKQYSFTDNTVIAGQAYSYRLKQIDFDGQFEYSSIVNVEAGIPTEFNLEQNYPNPFNPTTSISFSLPKAAQVNLSVYNVLGEKVAQLINTQMEAGKHTINFNASNLSTGTYIYRIETPEFSTSKKMMLVK